MDCIRKVMFSDIYCNIILNFINFINLLIGYSFSFIHWLIQKLNHQSLFHKKTLILLLAKITCSLFLFNSAIDVTKNYLKYPYIYKLVVSDNSGGFDLPKINICTEKNVKFDIRKVINYFNCSKEIDLHEERLKDIHEEALEDYQEQFQNYRYSLNEDNINDQVMRSWLYYDRLNRQNLISVNNYNLSKVFKNYLKFIDSESNWQELNNLAITGKELFECSANIHFRNEKFNSNSFYFNNCFATFNITETIGDNNFGICYTFFAKNYSIYLKNTDSINITINRELIKRFLKTGYQNTTVEYEFHFQQIDEPVSRFSNSYFGLFLFTLDGHSSPDNLDAFQLTNIPFNAQLKFEKTTVQLLSTPYMQKCKDTCK